MLEQRIIDFIEKTIENYDSNIEITRETYNSSIDRYADELIRFKEDINAILEIDMQMFEDILEESSLDELSKKNLYNTLKSIKVILESNANNHTTFKISNKQKEAIVKFFEIVERIKEDNQATREQKEKEIEKLEKDKEKLIKILGILEDPNNSELIEDIDVIVDAIRNSDLSIELKKGILYSILVYNRNQMTISTPTNTPVALNLQRLNINDVRKLFTKYGYDFNLLPQKVQDDILTYGDLTNMDEVFDCLRANNFPTFNISKDDIRMSRMLINCDKTTITNIVNYSKIRGINSPDLLKVIPALVKQTRSSSRRQHREPGQESGKSDSPIVPGRSEDYVKNIDFLEKLGFNIREVFDQCHHILTTSHERLVNNYRKFRAYHLSFKKTSNGTLTCPALSFLGSTNFEETIDQFIETSPLGYDYIKDNLSRLKIADPKDLIFYKIYASYMKQSCMGSPMIPEGPFAFFNSSKLLLRGEITNDNSMYRGLNDNNKQAQTMTVDPVVRNQVFFDKAVRDKEADINFYNFRDPRIEELDEYIDPTDPLVYDFNGTRISVLKVRRVLYLLHQANVDGLDDSLLYAITYNTIIDQNNFNKIKNMIRSRRI